MPLIPLRSGRWVCARGHIIHFPQTAYGSDIPSGLTILTIDPVATDNASRRSLFERLGVRKCDTSEVCRAIIDQHSNQDIASLKLTRQQLVEQTTYLFASSWTTSQPVQLWFATADETHRPSFEVYIRDPCGYASCLGYAFDIIATKFPFIHGDYAAAIRKSKDKWKDWLSSSFGVATLPRLIKQSSLLYRSDDLEMSEEMTLLFSEGNAADILWILREYWSHYSKYIEDNSQGQASSSKGTLCKAIGALSVKCRNEAMTPLCKTFLPSLDHEIEDRLETFMLCLHDPCSPRWRFLEHFGVAVSVNLQYYTRCLELLSGTTTDKHILEHIYRQIEVFYYPNEAWARYVVPRLVYFDTELYRHIFQDKRLLFLPTAKRKLVYPTHSWLKSEEARKFLPMFEEEYSGCTLFFRCLLLPGDDGLSTLIAKATIISDSTPLPDIHIIFRDINRAIQGLNPRKATAAIKSLITRPILPVITSSQDNTFNYLARPLETGIYLTDRDHLFTSFRGMIPVFAFPSEELANMQDIMRLLKLGSRQLSKLVESKSNPQGQISVHTDYTNFLRNRITFMQS